MRNLLILLYWFCIPNIFSQELNEIPTQRDIVKQGALRYFQRLPLESWERLSYLAHMGTFQLLYHEHFDKSKKSPFHIFNASLNRRTPNIAWSLFMKNTSITNYDDVLKDAEFGVCAGLTMTTRKLQMLAFFDPLNLQHQVVPSKNKNPKAWFEFMKNKIDDMLSYNKMSIIPGFSNVLDFTKDRLLQKYFKQNIVRQWELVNVNFLQGLFQGYGGTLTKMSLPEILTNIEKIKTTLSLKINPIVFLAQINQKLFSTDRWIHVVQVVKVETTIDHSIILSIWDPNIEDPQYSSKVVISPNGEINFGGIELASVIPLLWDNYEIADMVVKNTDFCVAHQPLCTKIVRYKPIAQPKPFQHQRL